MAEEITLTGWARSPVNPSWTYGPIVVQFDLGDGGHTVGEAVWGAPVTDFRATLAGHPLMVLPLTTANYQLSPLNNDSGLVVWGPQSELVWLFSGAHWAAGQGYYQDETQAYDFMFTSVRSVMEPGTLVLALVAAVCWAVLKWRKVR